MTGKQKKMETLSQDCCFSQRFPQGPCQVGDLPQTSELASNRGRIGHGGRTGAGPVEPCESEVLSLGLRVPLPCRQPSFLSHGNMFSLPPSPPLSFLPLPSGRLCATSLSLEQSRQPVRSEPPHTRPSSLFSPPSSFLPPASCLSTSSPASKEAWYFSMESVQPRCSMCPRHFPLTAWQWTRTQVCGSRSSRDLCSSLNPAIIHKGDWGPERERTCPGHATMETRSRIGIGVEV